MILDRDLQSIQEMRNLVQAAKAAQKEYVKYTQEQVDKVVAAVAKACSANAKELAKMAWEETGFGNWQDKVQKNFLGSITTYEYIKNMKTIGIINEDEKCKIIEVGVPMGVIAAIIPSTNPTSTVMYKALISLKSGNGVVFSPHPSAKKCIQETVRIIAEALTGVGAPGGLIGCISDPTQEVSGALMKHRDIGMILATGGQGIVSAAYSSGNPAIGVGPGNGPAFIERTADVKNAVKRVFDSKTFDNGTICASEQSIVTENCIDAEVEAEAMRQGGYFLNEEESGKVGRLLLRSNGTMNPAIVGKTAIKIAEMAGVSVPDNTRILISRQNTVSGTNPYAREKLCPILGYYVENNWEQACERCISLLENEGAGHTMTIHTTDDKVVRAFALKKPVSRLLVNTPGALGGVGATTNLPPAFTLGCGTVGKSAVSDNISPLNLINIRRVAWGVREIEDVRNTSQNTERFETNENILPADVTQEQIEAITRAVLARLSVHQ